jgi:hypothetical protein
MRFEKGFQVLIKKINDYGSENKYNLIKQIFFMLKHLNRNIINEEIIIILVTNNNYTHNS